jgi:hypothetical protein
VATATLRWERRIPVETAVEDQSSRSYVAVLPPADRERVLAAERAALLSRFPDGTAVEPYVLHLVVGRTGGPALPGVRP